MYSKNCIHTALSGALSLTSLHFSIINISAYVQNSVGNIYKLHTAADGQSDIVETLDPGVAFL